MSDTHCASWRVKCRLMMCALHLHRVCLLANRRRGRGGGCPSSWTAGTGWSAACPAWSASRCWTCCLRRRTTGSPAGRSGRGRTRPSSGASWGWTSRRSRTRRRRSPAHASAEWRTSDSGPTASLPAENHTHGRNRPFVDQRIIAGGLIKTLEMRLISGIMKFGSAFSTATRVAVEGNRWSELMRTCGKLKEEERKLSPPWWSVLLSMDLSSLHYVQTWSTSTPCPTDVD